VIGQAMSDLPFVRLERNGNARKPLAEAKHRPLEGVRVVDVTHVIAGPWSTRVLADHGADVISIRNPAIPFLYPAIFEESYGKKQILLHLGMEKSKARFAELIKDADVLALERREPGSVGNPAGAVPGSAAWRAGVSGAAAADCGPTACRLKCILTH
jgi:hypothetical protein